MRDHAQLQLAAKRSLSRHGTFNDVRGIETITDVEDEPALVVCLHALDEAAGMPSRSAGQIV